MMKNMKWKGLNFSFLRHNANNITHCKDYVPIHLHPYLDMGERAIFLKDNDLYNEINKIKHRKRKEFKNAKSKREWVKQDIIRFVETHKEYEDLLNQ